MTVKTSVNVSGTWQTAKNIYVNVSGTWQKTKAIYTNVAGTWQRIHTPYVELSISGTVYNYDIASAVATSLGYTPTLPVNVIITVNSGAVVGQSTTVTGTGFSRIQSKDSTAAMQTGTLPSDSTITIINNGYIVGCGGQGGDGNDGAINGVGTRWQGGDALYATFPCTIYNNGTIGGGGGGGKGGDGGGSNSTAGGGGAGSMGGVGGFGYGSGADRYGGTGTLTTGGAGTHDTGDEGGNLGLNGNMNTGHDGSDTVGLAGNYVVGNSYVTWATTGTRLGTVS